MFKIDKIESHPKDINSFDNHIELGNLFNKNDITYYIFNTENLDNIPTVSYNDCYNFLIDQGFIPPFDIVIGNNKFYTCFAFKDKSNDMLFKLKFD